MATRIVDRRLADENHAVTSVDGGAPLYRREPCAECPFRLDARVGEFPAEAYRLSAPTAYDMSGRTFGCHMTGTAKPATCAGFILTCRHNMRVRLSAITGAIDLTAVSSKVPLYESYREMAEANGVGPEDPILRPCR